MKNITNGFLKLSVKKEITSLNLWAVWSKPSENVNFQTVWTKPYGKKNLPMV
jgi:hypothetical protein